MSRARCHSARPCGSWAFGSSSTEGIGGLEPDQGLPRPPPGRPAHQAARHRRHRGQPRHRRRACGRHAQAPRPRRESAPSRSGDLADRQQRSLRGVTIEHFREATLDAVKRNPRRRHRHRADGTAMVPEAGGDPRLRPVQERRARDRQGTQRAGDSPGRPDARLGREGPAHPQAAFSRPIGLHMADGGLRPPGRGGGRVESCATPAPPRPPNPSRNRRGSRLTGGGLQEPPGHESFRLRIGLHGPPLRRAGPWRFLALTGTVTEAAAAGGPAPTRPASQCAPSDRIPTIRASLRISPTAMPSSSPPRPTETAIRCCPRCTEAIAASRIGWIGYLSTIGVYGDQGGAWIDETTPPAARSGRSRSGWSPRRAGSSSAPAPARRCRFFVWRGSTGRAQPHREGPRGRSQRIVKKGQVFTGSMWTTSPRRCSPPRPAPGRAIYNVTDDEPTPPQTVIEYAAALAGLPPPRKWISRRRPLPHGAQLLRGEQAGAKTP